MESDGRILLNKATVLVVACSNSSISIWKRNKEYDWTCLNQISSKNNHKFLTSAMRSMPSPLISQPPLITKTSAKEEKRTESPTADQQRPSKPVVTNQTVQHTPGMNFMVPNVKYM